MPSNNTTASDPGLTRASWDALLTSNEVDLNLEDLAQAGVIKSTFPELAKLIGFGGSGTGHKDLWEHTKIVVRQTLRTPLLRWAALFHDCGKPRAFLLVNGEITFRNHEVMSANLWSKAARRSTLFTADEVARVHSIIRFLGHVEQYEAAWTDAAVRRLALELGGLTDDVLALARADCSTRNSTKRRAAQRRCHDLKVRFIEVKLKDAIPPALPTGLGDAIMVRLGIDPQTRTPAQNLEMGRLTRALKAMVEAGELPRSGEISLYMDKLEGLL
jgi:poly(A) polymerase